MQGGMQWPVCLVTCSTDPHQRARGAHNLNTLEKSVDDFCELPVSGSRDAAKSLLGLGCSAMVASTLLDQP